MTTEWEVPPKALTFDVEGYLAFVQTCARRDICLPTEHTERCELRLAQAAAHRQQRPQPRFWAGHMGVKELTEDGGVLMFTWPAEKVPLLVVAQEIAHTDRKHLRRLLGITVPETPDCPVCIRYWQSFLA